MVFFKRKTKNPVRGSIIDRAYRFFTDRLPYNVRRFLQDNGHLRIESITVYRQPITHVIDKLFKILSLGRFDEAKHKLGYDDLYHLYIIIQLSDDSRVIVEKNQDIHIGSPDPSKETGEKVQVDLQGKQPTLFELIDNTRKYMGDSTFYGYDAFGNNCQDFIINVLRSNRLLTPHVESFVKQKVGDLLKTLPQYTSSLANMTTSTGSYLNRFLQSIGLKGFIDGGLVV